MTEPMVDDALVEKVARGMVARRYPSLTDAERDEMWDAWVGDAQAAIAIAYPAGVAAGREEAAKVADENAASSVPLMKGLGVAALVETGRYRAATEIATAIRQRGE